MIQRWYKRILSTALMTLLATMPVMAVPQTAHANDFTKKLLYGAAAMAFVSAITNAQNEHQQSYLKSYQQKTGVLDDGEAIAQIELIAKNLKDSGQINNTYALYVNAGKEINAFCGLGRVISVNIGTVKHLTNDELASILAHEMAHGEKKHVVDGVTKAVGLNTALNLYLGNNQNGASLIVGSAAVNMVNNEVFTMQQEWEADSLGYEYLSNSGHYNPGAPAAAMVKIKSRYGDLWNEGAARVVNPNNHPKTADRISNFAKLMTQYSQNHITVSGNTVFIDNKPVIIVHKTLSLLAEERAYLTAGHLAQLYHQNKITTAYVKNDCVYIGNTLIFSPLDEDAEAAVIADAINSVTGK